MNTMQTLFQNRWLRITLLAVLIQQSVVATGTYLMGSLAAHMNTEGLSLTRLGLLFLCVTIPGTLIHYAATVATVRANRAIVFQYLASYSHTNFNHPTHWRNETSKAKRHHVMTKSGQEAIVASIDFAIDLFATGLNVLLNTFSVILVTNGWVGGALALAALLGMIIIHLEDSKITAAAKTEMQSDALLTSHLTRSWDNVILGNVSFFERWRSRLEALYQQGTHSALGTVRTRDRAVAIAGFTTNALVVGTSLGLAWIHRADMGFTLAIVVMLPRSLQIVMHLQIIQGYWARWKNLRERLRIVDESTTTPSSFDIKPFIQFDRVTLRLSHDASSVVPLESIGSLSSGRLTLIGENGAGKSTLLLYLKERHGTQATYLPAQHHLEPSVTELSLSSGQAAMAFLKELHQDPARILLLDEWDANLSATNRALFDEVVNELSKTKVVVEVRHFHAG